MSSVTCSGFNSSHETLKLLQDSTGFPDFESCVSYSTRECKVNSCLGSPDEGDEVNLSVGMHKCPEGALERGILVKPGANLISYPPAPGKIKHSLPGVISKIAFFSDMLFRPSLSLIHI